MVEEGGRVIEDFQGGTPLGVPGRSLPTHALEVVQTPTTVGRVGGVPVSKTTGVRDEVSPTLVSL